MIEIDHNFSKAHQIITASILPIIERYGKQSQGVLEGTQVNITNYIQTILTDGCLAKFWKQFFELSANVKLNGREDDDFTETAVKNQELDDEDEPTVSMQDHESHEMIEQELSMGEMEEETSIIDSPSNVTGMQNTPRLLPSSANVKPIAVSLRPRASVGSQATFEDDTPSTPHQQRSDMQFPNSSPFDPTSTYKHSTIKRTVQKPLLCRVLDKSYHIQATPFGNQNVKSKSANQNTPKSAMKSQPRFLDSSSQSSPAEPPPQLRADLFSPAPRSARRNSSSRIPRTPGATPSSNAKTRYTSTGRAVNKPEPHPLTLAQRTPALWDSDIEDDFEIDEAGMSPPKTLQFVIPNSRLVQTPAREASKRIVEDLLTQAGADGTEEIEGLYEGEAPSPTVVRGMALEDESF